MANGQESHSAGDLSSQTTPAASMAVSGHTPVQTSVPATPTPAALTPTHAMLVASPAQVVEIVSSAANDGQSDRIVVQLDPPELGRVSIDFKFDANGLQHVTVTGESPEAVRQLRLMHYELTQALERHGITSQNMSFQQQHQNAQNTPLPYTSTRQPLFGVLEDDAATETLIATISLPSPRAMPGGRLDMKF
jgi:flagellar hook-length control protein FliK